MITLKLRKFGNSIGVILPKEVLAQLKVDEGDVIHLTESTDGYRISSFDPSFEETMKAFEDTYSQYRNAFKELAK